MQFVAKYIKEERWNGNPNYAQILSAVFKLK